MELSSRAEESVRAGGIAIPCASCSVHASNRRDSCFAVRLNRGFALVSLSALIKVSFCLILNLSAFDTKRCNRASMSVSRLFLSRQLVLVLVANHS